MKKQKLSARARSLLVLLLALVTSGEGLRDRSSAREPLVGAWRLLWLEEPGADGEVHRADCTGLLVYTPDGHMSVQVMYRSGEPGSGTAPTQYAQGGYEASYGTYDINDDQTFTFHVEGALVRALVGKDLKRRYELSGKQMIVRSSDPNERWRVAWERY